MLTKEQILQSFDKTEGILKGHFILTSGRHADTYMQCAKLFIDPVESQLLTGELAKKLVQYNAQYVVSPAVGGIIFGYELSRQLKIKNVFTERVDGKMTLRRGFSLPQGSHVIVAEDVVTTGGSVKEVIQLLQDEGHTVAAVAAIVDRSNGAVSFGVPFQSLLSVDVKSYPQDECPLCKEGKIPAYKPGSRGLK